MKSYVVRLEHEKDGWGSHGELCCLIRAASAADVEEPLRALMHRLRAHASGALKGVKELSLIDIIELPDQPADAVLWTVSWKSMPQGTASIYATLPIDDSKRAEAHTNGDPDQPGTLAPFMVFAPALPKPRPRRKKPAPARGKRRAKPAQSRAART